MSASKSRDRIESIACPTCGAARGCSCIVPNPNAPDVLSVDGRHFHRLRVGVASVHTIADAEAPATVAEHLILNDQSRLIEERCADHFEARMDSGRAPPVSYRVNTQTFDSIAARTCAQIQFGGRDPDGRREERILIHTACGVLRIELEHGKRLKDGEISAKEHGER